MPSEDRITTALIGCGNRGVNALGAAAKRSAKLDLVAVCDVDEARLEAAEGALGVPGETDYHRLLARDDLRSVLVATNAKWHVPIALDAVRAGKHVLVEKPLADSAAAARELSDTAAAAGVVGMVGYQGRFTAFAQALQREAAAVEPVQVLVTRQRGPFRRQFFFPDHFGGIVDTLTHEVHLALWVMGGTPAAVYGSVQRGTILGDQTIEFITLVVESAATDSGPARTATVVGSMHGLQAPNVVQVVGLRGTVTSFDRRNLQTVRHGGIREPAPARPEGLEANTVETAGDGDALAPTGAMLDHFADLVAGRTTEPRGATLREGMYALAVTQAAVEAARTGRRVAIDSLL
jgi:predicted dehydrogenase